MLDRALPSRSDRRRFVLRPTPQMDVARHMIGRSVEEAVRDLPRIFNLCATAQRLAACAAFGAPMPEDPVSHLRQEVLRDHLFKLRMQLPARLGLPQPSLPLNWQTDSAATRDALFGARGAMPQTTRELDAMLDRRAGIGDVLMQIRARFAPGEAVSPILPPLDPAQPLIAGAFENSVAARHARRPLMRSVERAFGRGPLWRLVARGFDAEAAIDGRDFAAIHTPAPGIAVVPAARGSYILSVRASEGRVTALRRITPSDHMIARGGVLESSLDTLGEGDAVRAQLVVDILDPCQPVAIEEVNHA